MNEHQRQAYLSSLGVENYMPRWRLPVAPEPLACTLPVWEFATQPIDGVASTTRNEQHQSATHNISLHASKTNSVAIADVLRDLAAPPMPTVNPELMQALPEPISAETVRPFALSIWRPQAGLLIIDSRNTQLALPTELLLRNILRTLFGVTVAPEREEVLRWPLVKNDLISRTEEDARNALQVWLEVELEQRPVTHLLLLGGNAVRYLFPDDFSYEQNLWNWFDLPSSVAQAMIAPSLVELLQQPLLKRKLWRSLTLLKMSV